MDPGSETMTIDQDYSGSDPKECKTDADCIVHRIVFDDGKTMVIPRTNDTNLEDKCINGTCRLYSLDQIQIPLKF